ncbi:MAG: prolyl oligopeptidase family serine peptidase [Phycisphaerae bacterium]|nr:prolyl oligopeptidase family serine peptidase [Phycisphaerae bacterium]
MTRPRRPVILKIGYLLMLPLLAATVGCPVFPADTPVEPLKKVETVTGRPYWLYVPSYYSADRNWPLVVTLHGTHGFDSSSAQIKEWKGLAEEHGLIVVAPTLRCVQGILPVIRGAWEEDLQTDERTVLAVIDEMSSQYKIDPEAILLTGFSAGGYPLYYIGLRNPTRFNMLIARSCNSDLGLFEGLDLTDDARKLPIMIFWGKDDPGIQKHCWQAYRWLRNHDCNARKKKVKGGHYRRPGRAYQYWRDHLPERHKR